MADHPIGEHAAAAAIGYAELFGINVAALDDLIHPQHQIAEIVARIVVLNNVAKLLAIGGAAARVGIKHNVSLGGHPLEFMIKDITVSSMRAAVDIQNQWIFFCRIEIRRLLYPGLHAFAIKAGVPDFFRRSEVELGEKLVIHMGEL